MDKATHTYSGDFAAYGVTIEKAGPVISKVMIVGYLSTHHTLPIGVVVTVPNNSLDRIIR